MEPRIGRAALVRLAVTVVLVNLSCIASEGGLPVAWISGSVICCPEQLVRLDGWASIDVGGEIKSWVWDTDGDGVSDTTSGVGEIVFLSPRKARSYTVVLRVRDNEGNLSLPDSASLHVMNTPPRVDLGPDTTVKLGVRVLLDPVITTPCGEAVLYEWDLNNDGTFEYSSHRHGRTSKAYHRPGRYRVRFRVTDSLNRQAGAIRSIVVAGSHAE